MDTRFLWRHLYKLLRGDMMKKMREKTQGLRLGIRRCC